MALTPTSAGQILTAAVVNVWLTAIDAATAAFLLVKQTTYVPTLANCDNTGSETTVLSFSIPAASMSDGDVIDVYHTYVYLNSGAARSVTAKVNVGAGAQVALFTTRTAADDVTIYNTALHFRLQRRGSTVSISMGQGDLTTNPMSSSAQLGSSTPTNFTGANTVSLKVTLSAASATFYWRATAASGGCAVISHIKN